MLLVSSGGLLRGYDDKTLNALVAISKKHEIKLILDEPNHGCGMLSRRLVSALQRDTHELGVEDADGSFVVKDAVGSVPDAEVIGLLVAQTISRPKAPRRPVPSSAPDPCPAKAPCYKMPG